MIGCISVDVAACCEKGLLARIGSEIDDVIRDVARRPRVARPRLIETLIRHLAMYLQVLEQDLDALQDDVDQAGATAHEAPHQGRELCPPPPYGSHTSPRSASRIPPTTPLSPTTS